MRTIRPPRPPRKPAVMMRRNSVDALAKQPHTSEPNGDPIPTITLPKLTMVRTSIGDAQVDYKQGDGFRSCELVFQNNYFPGRAEMGRLPIRTLCLSDKFLKDWPFDLPVQRPPVGTVVNPYVRQNTGESRWTQMATACKNIPFVQVEGRTKDNLKLNKLLIPLYPVETVQPDGSTARVYHVFCKSMSVDADCRVIHYHMPISEDEVENIVAAWSDLLNKLDDLDVLHSVIQEMYESWGGAVQNPNRRRRMRGLVVL